MLTKDEGIVLATSRSGETSLLVNFLGRASGKIRLLAKGALGSRHPARGLLEAGNHLEVVYYDREGRTLFFLKEASLLGAPHSRESLAHMAAMLAAVELLDQVCYGGGADSGIVDLGVRYLDCHDATDPLLVFLAFELQLLGILGVEPDFEHCAVCGRGLERGAYSARSGEAFCATHAAAAPETLPLTPTLLAAVRVCREGALDAVSSSRVERAARKALGKILHRTYTCHVQGYNLPKSLNLIT